MKIALCLLLCVLPIQAQNPTIKEAPKPVTPEVRSVTFAPEELLKIHDLVQRQNQQVFINKQAQLDLERSRTAVLELQEQINAWIKAEAAKRKINLDTHYFDFVKLDFLPIPPKKETQ